MRTAMPKRLLWATLTPLFLTSLVVLLGPCPAVADMHVTGDKTAFERLLNGVLHGTGATVAVHPQTGRLVMHGQPISEFGLQVQEKIASRTRAGQAIADPHGRPVSITIHAVRNQPYIAIGCFAGHGVQIIDIDDIHAFPQQGAGLPTQAAQLAHEFGEVFDSVRHGRTTPLDRDRKPHGQRDFDLNHRGGAHADENAVNRQEAGIMRAGEGMSLQGGQHPDGTATVIIREPFTRGDVPLWVETTLLKRADGTVQVTGVALAATAHADAPASAHLGRFATVESLRPQYHMAFQASGVEARQKPGSLDRAWWWKLPCLWYHMGRISTHRAR